MHTNKHLTRNNIISVLFLLDRYCEKNPDQYSGVKLEIMCLCGAVAINIPVTIIRLFRYRLSAAKNNTDVTIMQSLYHFHSSPIPASRHRLRHRCRNHHRLWKDLCELTDNCHSNDILNCDQSLGFPAK